MGGGLAFGKIKGISLPNIMKSFLSFSFSPKIYLWKKKVNLPPKLKKEKIKPELKKKEETPTLTVMGKSKLKDTFNRLQTGS